MKDELHSCDKCKESLAIFENTIVYYPDSSEPLAVQTIWKCSKCFRQFIDFQPMTDLSLMNKAILEGNEPFVATSFEKVV